MSINYVKLNYSIEILSNNPKNNWLKKLLLTNLISYMAAFNVASRLEYNENEGFRLRKFLTKHSVAS